MIIFDRDFSPNQKYFPHSLLVFFNNYRHSIKIFYYLISLCLSFLSLEKSPLRLALNFILQSFQSNYYSTISYILYHNSYPFFRFQHFYLSFHLFLILFLISSTMLWSFFKSTVSLNSFIFINYDSFWKYLAWDFLDNWHLLLVKSHLTANLIITQPSHVFKIIIFLIKILVSILYFVNWIWIVWTYHFDQLHIHD